MYFRTFYDLDHSCASYLIGDELLGQAFLIDPLESVGADEYIMTAAEKGLNISHIFETHVHADHKSSAREIAEGTGAEIVIHESTPAHFAFTKAKHGDTFKIGATKMTVLHTPGHTPESVTYVVSDESRGDLPWLAFTGDTIFVGDVGRPDLVPAHEGATDEGPEAAAGVLYDSLHEKFTDLPDTLEIYPAHFGGSSCGGKNLALKPTSTLGYERRYNLALNQPDKKSFIDFILMGRTSPPPAFIRAHNLGEETKTNA